MDGEGEGGGEDARWGDKVAGSTYLYFQAYPPSKAARSVGRRELSPSYETSRGFGAGDGEVPVSAGWFKIRRWRGDTR